jgi:hypothetical protein
VSELGSRPVFIDVTIGEVRLEGWDRAALEAEIEPTGPGERASALDLRVEETADAVTIVALQRDGQKDPALRTRVVVRLPATGVVQRVALFEGRLEVGGLRGTVTAKVERGPISASRIAGIVRLETGSGDLTVNQARLSPVGLLRLRTFNGDLYLDLAEAPPDARVLGLTLNGAIRSLLPLSERAGFGPRFREGVFGKGEPLISLDAVRGDITIGVAGRKPETRP